MKTCLSLSTDMILSIELQQKIFTGYYKGKSTIY